MTWESAVIIGLCSLNLLLLVGLVLRPAPVILAPPAPKPEKRSDGRIPLTDPDPYKPEEKSKDNGSVILMTQERDARLLDGQDE